ncbi:unnamed protein product [Orchesella dallaii]|uniref:Uncharacterized protein n=1 Tax=Orchesella dallaii TaxID=48710 RepID=A0ABP1RGP1_9HEXA
MLVWIELLFCVFVVAFWWYKNDQRRYSKYPPGPVRLPIVGNVLQMLIKSTEFPALALQKLADEHGDVMFIKIAGGEAVVCSSCDAIKEMLNHENAIGRLQYEFIRDRHANRNLGVIWSWGPTWRNLRRFTVRNLRDFGFGKSSQMDSVINEELDKFLEHMRQQIRSAPNNTLYGVTDFFHLTFNNVLWRLVSGKSYGYHDPQMMELLRLNREFFNSTNFGLDLSETFPILRDLFPKWSGRAAQLKTSKDLFDYGRQMLEEQRQLGTYKEDPSCFLDVFIAKVEESRKDPNSDFNDDQFVTTILDLLVAGSETSSKTLTFGMLYMMLYPQVQEKVQEEIDQVVPDGFPIDSSMKSKLPYTSAVFLEVFRYSTVVPIPTAREATDDFIFRGFFIKKGTGIIANTQAVHFSEKLWGDPYTFRPERFLSEDGSGVDMKKADLLLTFGYGKRICLGMVLAETTTFLYFATMLRTFRLEKLPGANISLKPTLGITLGPQPFNVKIFVRVPKN